MEIGDDFLEPTCSCCSGRTSEPYIECAECEGVNLCTSCFSTGAQFDRHRSDHDYWVCRYDFPLFDDSDWSARDEFRLLKAVARCGIGNWRDVSRNMTDFTEYQCKQHYEQYYINNPSDGLPKLSHVSGRTDPPYLFREINNEELPRKPDSEISQSLSGYNAYRSEFEVNFDNRAEQLLQFDDTDDEDDDLGQNLRCAVVSAYNNRLRERHRRYRIIRDHGLILFRKFSIWLLQFEETLGRSACEHLSGVMQLLSGIQFDALVESLNREKEIRTRLYKLYDLRRNGITTTKGRELYETLKKRREDGLREIRSNRDWDWKQLSENNSYTAVPINSEYANKTNRRRILPPLDIIGMPDYEKLAEGERVFCSNARLPPTNFIQFRDLLVSENDKNGFVRLCDARKLIKIDVNKTRKLYDYLIAENLIKNSA